MSGIVIVICLAWLLGEITAMINRADVKAVRAGPPPDPYRMERLKAGEPLDPDLYP